jgi:STE24 endopeptidase
MPAMLRGQDGTIAARGQQAICLTLGLLLVTSIVYASADTPALRIPPGAEASPAFDAARATDAYLASVPPDKKARSDAYFEGGYWLQLWNVLYSVVALWALLAFGWSAAMRDFAGRLTKRRPLQTALYWIQFVLYMSIVTCPLTVYSDFYREHEYGLATQTFWPWMADQLKGLGLVLGLGGLALIVLYDVLRRVGRSWWLWATGLVVAFSIFGAVITPVFIAPVFNTYTRLTDPRIRDPILSMARANGIGVDAVYVVDQSRQTTRISANVSGLFGTTRVSLNDNLLQRASLEEIEAVLGHEMGHYVLNHILKDLIETSLVIAVGFALIARGFERLRQRRPRWGIAAVGDVAGLPLIVLLLSVYQFVATPIRNTIIRTTEYEADIFGLNASRQPDGFASAALKLGEYRKLAPGAIEELIFFDHPSGRTRIFSAMRWKAEHPARQPSPAGAVR